MNDSQSSSNQQEEGDQKPNLMQVVGSVFAAAFGVQSSKNRERDFKHGSHKVFIIAGIVGTLLFLATLITIVQIVLGD